MSRKLKTVRPKFRFTVRIAILALVSLTALIFAAQNSSAAEAGGLKAEVIRSKDGSARVIFQPVGSSDKVQVYTHLGELIGQLDYGASFELSVTEKALREATKKNGIDIRALLKGVGTVDASSKLLVGAQLPYAVESLDGLEIPAGSQVYFALEGLAKEGVVAPVVAWGGKTMGPGGAANEFNSRLLDKGVTGTTKRPEAPSKTQGAKTGRQHVHGAGAPDVALDASDIRDDSNPLDTRFLTSPVCTERSGDSMRMSSYWGRRKSFRTSNGARASSWHDGLDIAGKAGTPIVAAADGCMTTAQLRLNRNTGYGLSITMDHAKGLSSQYSHMQKFSPKILAFIKTARKGEKLCFARGELLGAVGRTGNCTGPHLHFGVKQNGKSVDPRKHLRAESNADLSASCQVLAAQIDRLKPVHSADSTAPAHTSSSSAPGSAASGAVSR